MKKLMVMAVAGALAGVASAAAISTNVVPYAVDKVQLKLKVVGDAKLESKSYNGFAFWEKKDSKTATIYLWDTKAKSGKNMTYQITGDKKAKTIKNAFFPTIYPDIALCNQKVAGKKVGAGFTLWDGKIAYGAGKGDVTAKGGSLSGNVVDQGGFGYGTWKMTWAKQKEGWKVADILAKNKVEMGL